MTVRFTIPVWLIVGYPLVGLALYLPMEWRAHRRIHQPARQRLRFWPALGRGLKQRPYIPIVFALAWPWAMWEELR